MEITLTTAEFDKEVINSDIPVLVDFWATWCGPCRMLAPTVAQIAEENEGKVKVCKVDIDKEPKLAERYGVMSIPTVIAFKNGKEAARSVGLVPKEKLTSML
ncbi:MAG: thioredoxin [Oscillospiraceae bacterium]